MSKDESSDEPVGLICDRDVREDLKARHFDIRKCKRVIEQVLFTKP